VRCRRQGSIENWSSFCVLLLSAASFVGFKFVSVLARGDALGGQVAALRLGANAVIANHPAVVEEGEALTVGGGFVALAEQGV